MFGGPVTGNSPHLRKSGSRPVIGELGIKFITLYLKWNANYTIKDD